MKQAVLIAALLAAPHVALAQAYPLYSSAGHEYAVSCNASGYVLNSAYPVARASGQGASFHFNSGTETLYLGKSCDASSEHFGDGKWCWANGGMRIDFKDSFIGFPRQELSCETAPDLGLDCNC